MAGKAKRKHSPTRPAAIRRVKRIQEALEYRIIGHSFPAIAQQMRVSVGTAHAYVKGALTEIADKRKETAAELKTMMAERYDRLLAACMADAVDTELSAANREAAHMLALKTLEALGRLHGLWTSKVHVEGEAAAPQILFMYPEDANV